jgi:antirestriction protein ArdC
VAVITNETVDNSAAYIQGWLSKVRNDKKLLMQSAAQAQKVTDFILGNTSA